MLTYHITSCNDQDAYVTHIVKGDAIESFSSDTLIVYKDMEQVFTVDRWVDFYVLRDTQIT